MTKCFSVKFQPSVIMTALAIDWEYTEAPHFVTSKHLHAAIGIIGAGIVKEMCPEF
jgi:hypothetical protein